MSVNELIDFIFENYYKQIRFVKQKSYSMKHLKEKKKRFIVACKQMNRENT